MTTLDRLDSNALRLGWSVLTSADHLHWQASYGNKWIRVEFDRRGGIARVTAVGRKPLGPTASGKAEYVIRLLASLKARGTSNSNDRGNTAQRRARKLALLARDGNGEWALCSTCPTVVDYVSATVDRWPVPGADGGKYGPASDLSNVRLQCGRCAAAQGGAMATARKQIRTLTGLRALLELQ